MARWKINYEEGSYFAVPLNQGGFGIGLVARMGPEARGLLGYFFPDRYTAVPNLNELAAFEPSDAVTIQRFGDLGLLSGEWPIIGKLRDWNREKWKMPAFYRQEPIQGMLFRVEYPDDNPLGIPIVTRASSDEVEGLQKDGSHGYKSMSGLLSRLIEGLEL